MAETYFAAARLQAFLAIVADGLRDLTSGDGLSAFYDWADEVPPEEIASRYEESSSFRSQSDLPPTGEPSFTAQIAKTGSKNTFLQMVQEMGVEAQYKEDVTEETPTDATIPIPGLEDTIQALQKKGFTVDREAAAALFPDLSASSEPVKHLGEDSPTPWAQEDSLISMKWARAQEYVRQYFGGRP